MTDYTERLTAARERLADQLAAGAPRAFLLAELDHYRLVAEFANESDEADFCADLQDFLVGWCNPAMAL